MENKTSRIRLGVIVGLTVILSHTLNDTILLHQPFWLRVTITSLAAGILSAACVILARWIVSLSKK